MKRLIILVLVLAACGGEAGSSTGATAPTVTNAPSPTTTMVETSTSLPTASTTTAEVYDPFEEWERLGGPGLWESEGLEGTLSREDAQARALLGCGQEWAPGTIDALLAEAYRQLPGFCD